MRRRGPRLRLNELENAVFLAVERTDNPDDLLENWRVREAIRQRVGGTDVAGSAAAVALRNVYPGVARVTLKERMYWRGVRLRG